MTETLDVGDLRVCYTKVGSGPPLLLLHGGEGSHRMFDALVPMLSENFTVLAYDQRDCGATTGPGGPVSVLDLADDAAEFLLAAGLTSAHVYGSSFGGRVAQALAVRHPRAVDHLILGATWPLSLSIGELSPHVGEILRLRSGLPGTAGQLVEYFFPESYLATRPELRTLFAHSGSASERSVRRGETVADTPQVDVACIKAETLLLIGELDRVVPPAASKTLAVLIPHAHEMVLSGVGHVAVMQVPEVVAQHIAMFCLKPASFHEKS